MAGYAIHYPPIQPRCVKQRPSLLQIDDDDIGESSRLPHGLHHSPIPELRTGHDGRGVEGHWTIEKRHLGPNVWVWVVGGQER
jgi:hypothetical protein